MKEKKFLKKHKLLRPTSQLKNFVLHDNEKGQKMIALPF